MDKKFIGIEKGTSLKSFLDFLDCKKRILIYDEDTNLRFNGKVYQAIEFINQMSIDYYVKYFRLGIGDSTIIISKDR